MKTEIQFCQLLAYFWMLWRHMCWLITAATWDKQNMFICAITHLFIFLRNSSLRIGMDTLVKNHNQYLIKYLCVLNVCFMTISVFCRAKPGQTCQTNSQQLWKAEKGVSERERECEHSLQISFICLCSQHRINIIAVDCTTTSTASRSPSLTDEGIAANLNHTLHLKAFSILMW